jgi:hypothetical protein
MFGRLKMSATSGNSLAESTVALENKRKGPKISLFGENLSRLLNEENEAGELLLDFEE